MISNFGRLPGFRIGVGTAVGKEVVDEHHAVTDEAIIADAYEFANERVGLDTSASANANSFLDFHKGTNKGIVTKLAFVEIYWLYDGHAIAKLHISDFSLVFFRRLVAHVEYQLPTIGHMKLDSKE